MRLHSWLALVPAALALAGVVLSEHLPSSTVLGLPFLLAWTIGGVLATAAVMWLVFRLDPANRDEDPR